MIICLKSLTFLQQSSIWLRLRGWSNRFREQGFFKKPFLQINAKSMHFLCKDSITGKGDPLRAVMSVGRQPCILFFPVSFLSLVFHEHFFSHVKSLRFIDWLFVHYWTGKSSADVLCFWFARDLDSSSLFSISKVRIKSMNGKVIVHTFWKD